MAPNTDLGGFYEHYKHELNIFFIADDMDKCTCANTDVVHFSPRTSRENMSRVNYAHWYNSNKKRMYVFVNFMKEEADFPNPMRHGG